MIRKLLLTLLLIGNISIMTHAKQHYLLPIPKQIVWQNKTFKATTISIIAPDSAIQMSTNFFQELGMTIESQSRSKIILNFVPNIAKATLNQDEAYELDINSSTIKINATTMKGAFWAFQTLRQLSKIDRRCVSFDGCQITDWPSFRIRGMMQDVGRSYISMKELKKEIAKLAEYKINVFHWHLTENQSWRMQSKIFPMINDSVNTTRMKGKYYTLEEAKELVQFCKQHQVLLIPEFDMPGHSEAFKRTFRHDMQSVEGMKILKLLMDEVCETFDVPYIHIGTDEVQFKMPNFVPEMVAHIRSKGKKVISWNPGYNYKVGEIDMTQLWSYRGKAQPGIPAIDCRFHYINHFDTFADIIALYNSKIYNQEQGSDDIAGVIVALWHDRLVQPEENIILDNHLYPNMLAIAERSWLGGGTEYFDKYGTVIGPNGSIERNAFFDFERRMLWHKKNRFEGYPFPYVKQTNVHWAITDPFPNGGDLLKSFPPEHSLEESYLYEGKTYKTREAIGSGIYLRHVWGENTVKGFYEKPQPNHTAYAYTWVYSPKKQEVGLWAEFQNYSRSEKDLHPKPGKWDYKESRLFINNQEIAPPIWDQPHREKTNELPLGNVNMVIRKPQPITLHKGWNKVLIKLPIAAFTVPEVRLLKWMFSVAFVTPDGRDAIDNLVYSPKKIK